MHWLEKWRNEHGVSREELAEAVGLKTTAVITILEEMHGGVTHIDIAARIADHVGATPQQWDSIVPERYRGTYTPSHKKSNKRKKSGSMESFVPYVPRPAKPGHTRAVLKIDLNCRVLKRYTSVVSAAADLGRNVQFVINRLGGKLQSNEFEPMGITFRYEDAWNESARAMLEVIANECKRQRESGIVQFGKKTYLFIDGVGHTINEWSEIAHVKRATILQRLKHGLNAKDAVFRPVNGKNKSKGEKMA